MISVSDYLQTISPSKVFNVDFDDTEIGNVTTTKSL
jgi:hypothetical protein